MVAYETAPSHHMRLFRLAPDGSSYRAADAVFRNVQKAVEIEKPRQVGNLGEVLEDWRNFYRGQYETVQAKDPGLLHELGFTQPVTQVRTFKDGFPRAYQTYPAIYLNEGRKGPVDFYMYAPVDYRGRSFEPRDAMELTGQDKDRVGDMLFAGGWNDPPPVLPLTEKGTKMPDDFDQSKHYAYEDSQPSRSQAVFVAEGRSMEIVDDFHQRQRHLETTAKAVFDYLTKAATDRLGDKFREQLAPGEGFYLNTGRQQGGELGNQCIFSDIGTPGWQGIGQCHGCRSIAGHSKKPLFPYYGRKTGTLPCFPASLRRKAASWND